jgi:hypothetical protein
MSQLTAPEFLASAVLATLRTQFEQASREEAALEPRYLQRASSCAPPAPAPTVGGDLFRAEVLNIRGAAEAELRGVIARRGQHPGRARGGPAPGRRAQPAGDEYSRLSRERENHAKIYGIVLERATEGNLMRDLQVNNMSVLDYALLPVSPIKPRVFAEPAASAPPSGWCSGSSRPCSRPSADRTVRSRQDVEEVLGAPTCLGFLPITDRGMRATRSTSTATRRPRRAHRQPRPGGALAPLVDGRRDGPRHSHQPALHVARHAPSDADGVERVAPRGQDLHRGEPRDRPSRTRASGCCWSTATCGARASTRCFGLRPPVGSPACSSARPPSTR